MLVPTRDRTVSASSKNYRYSANLQVLVKTETPLVLAVGRPLPGNRNDCTAFAESGMKAASSIAPRARAQSMWFPGRRKEKAVFDICCEVADAENPTSLPAHRILAAFVSRSIEERDPIWSELSGFQFLLAQYSGHDDSEEPEYVFVSPFISSPAAAGSEAAVQDGAAGN
ncbi:hypothetical protein [Streptomyces halobius]|uniref:Uncharacterized protein n=1 Tax=Streptomyces halobius TaxID=2879846 RepID=A0ABY4MKC6_9ACTN|nr:hypothetical protein [Streptomyces halobius]UQA98213.1 hypothetical protein K9S39_41795 [Streptomyces halobius]